jgi:ABC-type uncharacterized transport system auxiliary subunit
MRYLRSTAAVLSLAAILTGCLSMTTQSQAPKYFQIRYQSPQVQCSSGLDADVRVWPLTASTPYDREQMILLDSEHKVRFSQSNRWVAPPGQMLSDRLAKDLSGGPLFNRVITPVDPFTARVNLGGNLYRCAWSRENGTGRAVLEVELTLWVEDGERQVLFRRLYTLKSEPAELDRADDFAEAVSRLARELSLRARRDICARIEDSSFPGVGKRTPPDA